MIGLKVRTSCHRFFAYHLNFAEIHVPVPDQVPNPPLPPSTTSKAPFTEAMTTPVSPADAQTALDDRWDNAIDGADFEHEDESDGDSESESEDGSNHGDVLQADENFRPEGYGGYDEDDELEEPPPILSFDSDSEYELDGEPDGED